MREMPYIEPYRIDGRRDGGLMRFVNAIKKYYLMMLNLAMFMLQLMLNIMIMLNCLKNGLVVI
ncbi:MAG: hypothetical protein [Bacteriophage sp.]|nr:MAG: hypothetical protein [Bacteriophage sp.]